MILYPEPFEGLGGKGLNNHALVHSEKEDRKAVAGLRTIGQADRQTRLRGGGTVRKLRPVLHSGEQKKKHQISRTRQQPQGHPVSPLIGQDGGGVAGNSAAGREDAL